ncbi:MAG: carbohydrate kinase family protein [Oscillospiraceae bacterium]|nr:carbohydrate kinase family protein [Oscillospiraceae bacterium]
MNKKRKVLVVGDINVDLVVRFPQMLPEGSVKYYEPELTGGGTCGNTLIALSKLGVSTAFMGTVGDDAYGLLLKKEMVEADVDIRSLITDEELNTVCVFAFVDEKGERYLWGWPRVKQSYQSLKPTDIRWETIHRASWIHSSGIMLVHNTSARKSVIEIFKYAKKAGIPTSFDLNLRVDGGQMKDDYREAVLEILNYCNYVLGSGKDEFYHLAPHDDWLESARFFASPERTIIARMGAEGAMAITPHSVCEERPFDVKVRDTVGAGDVFNAGFIAARIAGYGLRDSIAWGNGVSSYKVARNGGRATPEYEELMDFMNTTPKITDI